jgi:pre-rRNA-processing protein TSR3
VPKVIVGFDFSRFKSRATDLQAMHVSYPPTVIVRSARENPRKCSILPLKGREEMIFLAYPLTAPIALENYVRLAVEGEPLSPRDADKGLLLLDASWRRAGLMERDFRDVPPRSLQGYRTAYPRRSKRNTDPDEGLASVEALFLAYHILGRPTHGLLDHYRWAEEFLRSNEMPAGGARAS